MKLLSGYPLVSVMTILCSAKPLPDDNILQYRDSAKKKALSRLVSLTVDTAASVIPGWPSLGQSQSHYEVIYYPEYWFDKQTYDADKMLGLINDVRASNNLTSVAYNETLAGIAQNHAEFMSKYHVLTHADKDGLIGDRLTQSGFKWWIVAENVAAGYEDEDSVMGAWIQSPLHHGNLINPNVKYVGVGVAGGYWAQDFAAPWQ